MYQNSIIQLFVTLLHKALLPGSYKIQTFTYFIPSPPNRKTGYREKKFDSITQVIMSNGFKILNINCQTLSTEKASGMWVTMTIRPNNIESISIDLNSLIDDLENISQETEVEGVYQLDLEEGL